MSIPDLELLLLDLESYSRPFANLYNKSGGGEFQYLSPPKLQNQSTCGFRQKSL